MLLEGRSGRETLTSNVRELNEVKLGSLSTDNRGLCKHNKMIVQLTQDSHKLRVTSSFFFLVACTCVSFIVTSSSIARLKR